MRERPILFSAPMVRAILAGTKTQTRRVVKWRGLAPGINLGFSGLSVERSGSNWVLTSPTRTSHEYRSVPMLCPHGCEGDRLWVREAWNVWEMYNECAPTNIPRDVPTFYEADRAGLLYPDDSAACGRGRPSIHMPRWRSRIDLEITDVRVERLQSISHGDVIAEGVDSCAAWKKDEPVSSLTDWRLAHKPCGWPGVPGERFARLWESINGAGSWAANPWIWAISFQRVEAPTS